MGDPFRCGRCDTWFDYYEALEYHIAKEHPKPSDKSILATTQYELKEALLEISRHHADFKKVSQALDQYEADGDTKLLYKTIRGVVG